MLKLNSLFTDSLRAESPEYLNLVERKNYLLSLTEFQRKLLCANILSSPAYHTDRVEVTKHFLENTKESFDVIEQLTLSFDSDDNEDTNKNVEINNSIPCYGFINYDNGELVNTRMYYFTLTQSYNDRNSLYILLENEIKKDNWFLDNYFENISLLTNAHHTPTEGTIFEIKV